MLAITGGTLDLYVVTVGGGLTDEGDNLFSADILVQLELYDQFQTLLAFTNITMQ